jgi:hypothetical protein
VGKVPEGRTRTNSNEKAGIGGEILGLFEREFNSNKLVRSPFLKASIARETAGSTPWECGEEIFFDRGERSLQMDSEKSARSPRRVSTIEG